MTALTDFRLAGADTADADTDAEAAEALGAALAPGTAVAAVVVEHRWLEALAWAAERAGGSLLAQEPWPRAEEDLVARAVVAARALADAGQRA